MLQVKLRQSLDDSRKSSRMGAMLLVDLDDFKTLNDSLGHQTGDLLLKEAATRLTACTSGFVARLGGDEFVVILESLSEATGEAVERGKAVAQKILASIAAPYQLAGRECLITCSIGITGFGDKQDSIESTMRRADIAMYQSKKAGRNAVCDFAPALQLAVSARASMEEDLRQAIGTNQLELYYQPQIDRDFVVGAEALLRWRRSEGNLLGPGEFIPLAEETGLIYLLGEWIIEAAFTQVAEWAGREETAGISVAVNISARQFRQPEFVKQILSALDRTGANPKRIKLELTESVTVDDVESVVEKMMLLRSHGLSFSLDDFGTGYSSLSYLKKLPLDQLKIDRSFVWDMLLDPGSGAIAQAIISLSSALNLSVIAEGVETEEQRDFLLRLGCHVLQGYLFSPPLPLKDFEEWLVSYQLSNACRREPSSSKSSLGKQSSFNWKCSAL
jgi:diguanylate cyclase (GGDEF)-like protein